MSARVLPILAAMTVVSASSAAGADPKPPRQPSFQADVAPILVKKCLGCHNAKKASGGLDMTTFALLRKGGKTAGEGVLEPGDPDGSLLVESVRPGASPRMPYKQAPLSDREIDTLTRWVKQGAKFDGPSEKETALASLVDPLRGLPQVPLKAPAVEAVTALAFAPDGGRLAAAVGARVVLYNTATGKQEAELIGHPGPLTALAIPAGGRILVAAGGRPGMFGSVAVWDLDKRTRRYEVRGHGDAILSASVSPDGSTLATSGYDRKILVWDLTRGAVVRELVEHTDAVHGVAFSPDGRLLASCAADRTVKLWDWKTGRRIITLSDATAELYAVVFTPDGSQVIASGADRSIRGWRISGDRVAAARSVFAHDAPVLRLVVTRDGKTLASSGEDRRVKLWDLKTLEPRADFSAQSDWPQALAFSPDGHRLAVGRFDGSLDLRDAAPSAGKDRPLLVLRERGGSGPAASKAPELVRNASLDPLQPRGAVRGGKVRLTLTGQGVGRAVRVVFRGSGLSAALVPSPKPQPNRAEVDLSIAADAPVGLHQIGVITPLGFAGFQPFAVTDAPEHNNTEPDDVPGDDKGARPVSLPATLLGTIDQSGDVDHFRFPARAGQELVFQVMARDLGSVLIPEIAVLDSHGRPLKLQSVSRGASDPVLTCSVPRDGTYTLRVADADYGGSGSHFYRISAGAVPCSHSVFPLGIERSKGGKLQVAGSNLGGISEVSLPPRPELPPGAVVPVPINVPGATRPTINIPSVVLAEGPQAVEHETGADPSQAQTLSTPGGVSGRIGRDQDVDHYRFQGTKGRRLIVEVFGRRLGSPIDPVIEILDATGRPIPRAVLRPVDQTEIAFRDHTSRNAGIRLTHWENLAINDYVLIGRELARIQALPRNPDDDCVMWNDRGERMGMLETTPEQHPLGQVMYKVEIHPPGAAFPPGGTAPVALNYRNDDGGRAFSKDSRLTFTPPADGTYLVRVEDVRGLGGGDFGYHLVIREPAPGFDIALSTENPNVARGGTTLVGVNLTRNDGFDGPVEVRADGLPPGIRSTPAVIEPGSLTGMIALTADSSAPAFSPPTWRIVATASRPDRPTAAPRDPLTRTLDPGGAEGGWITVAPRPNLDVSARPDRIVIRPGQQVALTLAVDRGPALKGRVPIDVRNLPQGVRVLNIGLNGVLITESQSERTVFLLAEPWTLPQTRPFYAVGKAEAASTEHASSPIELDVIPSGNAR